MNSAVCSTEIDMHQLIAEVKKRPLLWNVTMPEYSDKNAKISAWREISQVFMPSYDTEEPARKQEVSRRIQRRWKSLRDSFVREINLQKRSKKATRRTYRYYKQLSFLRTNISTREKREVIIYKNDSDMYENSTVDETNSQRTWSLPDIGGESQNVQIENHNMESSQLETSDNAGSHSENHNASPMRETSYKKCKNKSKKDRKSSVELELLKEVVAALRENKNGSLEAVSLEDGDKYFLLSLLGELRKVPEESKLDAKTEIMHVLKKWQKSPRNSTPNITEATIRDQNFLEALRSQARF